MDTDYRALFARHINKPSIRGDEIKGCCPFHPDNTPSWSGNIHSGLWQCFGCSEGGNAAQFAERVGEGATPRNGHQRRTIVATYDYRDEQGTLLFQSVRYEPKEFKQRRPDGNDGWIWSLAGVRRVLHHLPEILKEKTVYIVEGEKDDGRLRELEIPATTNPQGAGKWREEYNESLRGKNVVIIPDNDEPGEQHALQVARSLLPVAKAVKLVRLPDLPPKGDVSDWLDAGHTREELLKIVIATPLFTQEDSDTGSEYTTGEEQDPETAPDTAFPAFPALAWRGAFGIYREAMAGTTEASDVFHFATLWSAAAVRLRRRVCFSYGLDLYPNVDLAIFGPTGDKKTTAARRVITLLDDTTTKTLQGSGSGEGLADWLNTATSTDAVSHFLFLEELSELLARGKWDGATLIPFLTRVFDCPNKYETNYRKNPIALVNPTLSILACTTPEVFWQYIRDLDIRSGFVNRFLFLTGEGKEPIALPKKPDMTKLASVLDSLQTLDTLPTQEAHFSPEATDLWHQFYAAWRKTELESLVKAATERIPAYIIKLAITHAALEQTLPTIAAEQLAASIAVGHYATKCTEQLMGHHRQGSAQSRCEEAIRRVLKDTPHWLSTRQLWQRISGRYDSAVVAKALNGMVTFGEVEARDGTRKGQFLYRLQSKKTQG